MENDKLNIGDEYSLDFTCTQNQVELFALATGDNNPIHLDSKFAESTVFKRPIIHGFLGGAVFSKIFGALFPGQGTIYLKQSLTFLKPMYTGEKYKAVVVVSEINRDKHRANISTKVFNSFSEEVIIGEALVSNLQKI